MPFSSLAGAGFEAHGPIVARRRRFPHPVRPMLETPPPAPPTDAVPPTLPGDKKPPAPSFDDYVAGLPIPHPEGGRLRGVKVRDAVVLMHPAWANTALKGALMAPTDKQIATHNKHKAKGEVGPPMALDLNAITPEMVESLPPATLHSLMEILRTVTFRIRWQDPCCPETLRGNPVRTSLECARKHPRTFSRRKICGLQIGRRYKVNGATALAMRMAQVDDHRPFCDAMVAGLEWVAPSLRSRDGFELFGVCDVATILANVLKTLPQAPTDAGCDMLDAASTLVQRYFEHMCNESPDTFRPAFNLLLRALVPLLPHDADHIGLCIGVLLVGVNKYGGDITTHDNHSRWRVASIVNIIWSATSFSPLFLVAGPIAVGVVVGGVVYDRFTPVRDYTTLLGRFEAELMQVILNKKLPWLPEHELGRLFLRIRQAFKAAGLPA